MLLNRYKNVTDRCLELGCKMDTLTNEEGIELRRLLEEQAFLTKTFSRKVKGVLEEVRQEIMDIKSWLAVASEKVEKAIDEKGMPSDILALDEVMKHAEALRDKIRNLKLNNAIEEKHTSLNDSAEIRINLASNNHKEAKELNSVTKHEINSINKEVAATIARPIYNEIETISGDSVSMVPYIKPVEPMTYTLPKDIVAKIEKKLEPNEILPESEKLKSKKKRKKKKKEEINKQDTW